MFVIAQAESKFGINFCNAIQLINDKYFIEYEFSLNAQLILQHYLSEGILSQILI